MAVPNTFATDTSAIPLADLDANFTYYDTAYSITGTAVTFNGNIGVGVTPSAWSTTLKPIEIGNIGTYIAGRPSGNQIDIGVNNYYNAGYKYANSGVAATQYEQTAGTHAWYYAPSGTAGASAAVTSGQSYTVSVLGSSTLGQWQAFFSALSVLPTVGQIITATATGSIVGGGTVTQNITFIQAMTLNASGNLGIGTTSPATKLHVSSSGSNFIRSATTGTSGQETGYQIIATNSDASSNQWKIATNIGADNEITTYDLTNTQVVDRYIRGASGYRNFWTNGSERMRINSSGAVLVNATSALISNTRMSVDGSGTLAAMVLKGDNVSTPAGAYVWNATTTGNGSFLEFGTEAAFTTRGSVTYNRAGGLTVYGTTSDYRAKDISGPVTNSGTLIDSIPVYMGKMKWATEERPMFIAHEVPSYAHTGEKDAVDADGNPVYQQMDASALIPVMWAEIQSLRKRLAALESK